MHAFTGNITGNRSVFTLAGNLIHFINVDNAPLGSFDIKVGGLQQSNKNVFYVVANITRLCQGGCIGNSKRNIQDLCKSLCKKRLAGSGRTNQQNIALLQLHIRIARKEDALIVVIHRNSQSNLCIVLTDDITIHIVFDFHGCGQMIGLDVFLFALLQKVATGLHAVTANAHILTGNEPCLRFGLSAERTAKYFLFIFSHSTATTFQR